MTRTTGKPTRLALLVIFVGIVAVATSRESNVTDLIERIGSYGGLALTLWAIIEIVPKIRNGAWRQHLPGNSFGTRVSLDPPRIGDQGARRWLKEPLPVGKGTLWVRVRARQFCPIKDVDARFQKRGIRAGNITKAAAQITAFDDAELDNNGKRPDGTLPIGHKDDDAGGRRFLYSPPCELSTRHNVWLVIKYEVTEPMEACLHISLSIDGITQRGTPKIAFV